MTGAQQGGGEGWSTENLKLWTLLAVTRILMINPEQMSKSFAELIRRQQSVQEMRVGYANWDLIELKTD